MAIEYERVNWDTTKYVNPTNMNQMDAGIKAACDGVDENSSAITAINSKLSTFKDFEFRTVRLTYASANQLRNNNVDVPSGYSLANAIVLPTDYNGITVKTTRPIMKVATTGLIALGDGFTSSDVIELRVLYFK